MTAERCGNPGCASTEVVGHCRWNGHGYCRLHGPANGRGTCDRHRLRAQMLLDWGRPASQRERR